jgi:VanZ family protein
VTKKRALCLVLGWTMVGAIVWLSLTPSPPKADFEASDKLAHLLGYGTLMLWFSQLHLERKTRIAYAAGFAAMGVALEFVQGQLGYRTYEVFDMYANTLGVLLGYAAAPMLPQLLPRA